MNFPRAVILHADEISLKGENRPFFERILLENIRSVFPAGACLHAEKRHGTTVLWLSDNADEEAIRTALMKVFGIANFAFAFSVPHDMQELEKSVITLLKGKTFTTFRISARRADKNFPLTSQEINERLGETVVKEFGAKVNLEEPDLNCHVEVASGAIFIYFEKHQGYGGLPLGVSGPLLSLISSGLDSPVASWKMMRRGSRVSFVHFHSYPSTSKASQDNVREIVKILAGWQGGAKLFMVPFLPIQQSIVAKLPDPTRRVIVYRRFMMRIAERLAVQEKTPALVTGDSLGQVASQTIENIVAVSQAVSLPILRPLIGENKRDIVARAREIGTFEASSQPHEDCCSLFVPEHPSTRTSVEEVKRDEEKLDVEALAERAVADTKTELFS